MAIAYLGYKVDSSQVALAEKRLDGMSGAAGLAAKAARGLTVAIGAAFAGGAIIREISTFETSMSRVGAISRATAGELSAMRDVARDLGATTEFSAGQAADGLGFLAMAGFEASEAIAAIPDVLDLATASGIGLAQAADIASNVMSGFGIEAENAGNVADVLAAASSRANTNVSQLGRAMSTVAPISAAMGVSIEDTAAAIGVMSDAGIQGERAGTALRGVMASLAGPTDQARDALARYGITLDQINPETNELADIFQLLQERGLSTADAMTIFGREAASGALVMVEANQRLGEFGDELTRVGGAAADMADTMRDNLGGDIDSLKSAVSGLILSFGDAGLTGTLRATTQAITSVVSGIAYVIDLAGSLTGYIIAAAGALTASYIPSMYAAITATGSFTAALAFMKSALLATGIGALVVGAGILINKFISLVSVTGGVGSAFSALKDIASEVFERAGFAVLAFQNRSIAAWTNIRAGALDMWQSVLNGAYSAADRIVAVAVGIKDAFIAAFKAIPDALGNLMYAAANAVIGGVEAMINGVVGLINSFTGMINNTLNSLPEWARPEGGFNMGQISTVSLGRVSYGGGSGDGAAQDVGSAFSAAMGGSYVGEAPQRSGMLADMLGGVAQSRENTADVYGGLANAPLRSVEALQSLRNELDQTGMSADAVDQTISALSNSLDGSTSAGSGGGGAAGSTRALAEEMNEAQTAAQQFADAMDSEVQSAVDGVADAFGDFVARGFKDFKGFVRSVLDSFKQMLSNMIAMAARNRIMIALGIGGGGVGTSAAAGALQGVGGAGGVLGGVVNSVIGGFGPSASLFGSGGLAAGFGSLGGGTGLLGGLGNTLAATFGPGGGIGGLVSAIGGGGGLMASIGAAIPVIGLVAAAFSFFRKKVKVLDSGIQGAIDGLDVSINTFKTIQTSRFFGLSKKTSTEMGESQNELISIASDVQSSVLDAARVFGVGSKAFEDFSYKFKLSLKDMTEDEKLEAVNKELLKMGDSMAMLVPNFQDMNSLIQAANDAVAETYALGSTRFEAEILAAARRRGEITLDRAGQGINTSDSLIRMQNLEQNSIESNKLMNRLVNFIEGWQINGVPVEPSAT